MPCSPCVPSLSTFQESASLWVSKGHPEGHPGRPKEEGVPQPGAAWGMVFGATPDSTALDLVEGRLHWGKWNANGFAITPWGGC